MVLHTAFYVSRSQIVSADLIKTLNYNLNVEIKATHIYKILFMLQVSCSANCVDKYIKMTQRVSLRLQEHFQMQQASPQSKST